MNKRTTVTVSFHGDLFSGDVFFSDGILKVLEPVTYTTSRRAKKTLFLHSEEIKARIIEEFKSRVKA